MPVDALSADTPQPLPGVKERAGMAHSTRAPSTAIAPADTPLQRLLKHPGWASTKAPPQFKCSGERQKKQHCFRETVRHLGV